MRGTSHVPILVAVVASGIALILCSKCVGVRKTLVLLPAVTYLHVLAFFPDLTESPSWGEAVVGNGFIVFLLSVAFFAFLACRQRKGQ